MITLHLDDTIISSLTGNELNILKYVYGHPEEILQMSIQELARQVSYSSATILRFCKKLGYSGFAELKYALHAALLKDTAPPASYSEQTFSTQMLLSVMGSDVEGTSKLIQEEQLSQTFRFFDSGCPIYIWSPGGITSITAEYFEKLLLSIGRQNVYRIGSQKMCEHILRNTRADSLLILISTTGVFPPTLRLAKVARINNIPIISIAPYANNELAENATVSYRFFTHQREYRDAEYTSRLPIFFIINMIIHCYLEYRLSLPEHTPSEANHDSLI